MFTKEDLLKPAALAKLEISKEEFPALLQDMEGIVAFAATICSASPPSFPLSIQPDCPLRKDSPGTVFPQDEILREASKQQEGFFEIPERK